MTTTPLRSFFKSFIIIDEVDEEVHDPNMAPKVDFNNYGRKGMSIRTSLT